MHDHDENHGNLASGDGPAPQDGRATGGRDGADLPAVVQGKAEPLGDGLDDVEGVEDLTPKQRLFLACLFGVSRLNATDAARRAGYQRPDLEGWRLRQQSPSLARILAVTCRFALAAFSTVRSGAASAVFAARGRLIRPASSATGGRPSGGFSDGPALSWSRRPFTSSLIG